MSEMGNYLFRSRIYVVNVCALFCYCLLWLDAQRNRYMYIAHVVSTSVVVNVSVYV